MNISSGSSYPASSLSNFAGHRFIIDDVECYSMEGFLQSLKFKSVDMQEAVCKLVGKAAKRKGANKNWQRTQILYWKGEEINRNSKEYQDLLDRAYNEMYKQSESFRKALMASGNGNLTHSMGKTNTNETVLTISEFCGRLLRLRENGIANKK